MAYSKLASSIIYSTIWQEDNSTRIVWITLLAMADRHGEVMGSIPGIAHVAGVTVKECEKAFKSFLAPDKFSRSKVLKGRRVQVIEGGWQLVNYNKYRLLASRDEEKAKNAERQARKRARDKTVTVTMCHGIVTPDVHIADADAEADALALANRGTAPSITSNGKRTLALMQDASDVLGPSEMITRHKRWWTRATKEPDRTERTLAETRVAVTEGRIKSSPARYAEDCWKRFNGKVVS